MLVGLHHWGLDEHSISGAEGFCVDRDRRVKRVHALLAGGGVVKARERLPMVGGHLVGPLVDQAGQLVAPVERQIGAEAPHSGARELSLCGDADQVRERAVDDASVGRLHHGRAVLDNPVEGLEEAVVDPRRKLHLLLLGLPPHPTVHDAVDVRRLLVEKDHAHPRDGGG
eukprot:scaffold5708_cov107-Isochrysis_galbana.AAC.10